MDEINKREHITVRVKQLLQDNGVKLWLPPYHRHEDINNLTISDEILVSIYSNILAQHLARYNLCTIL